jgi:hypothetical protein
MKGKIGREKVYELWWAYLQRSDKYKKFCLLNDQDTRLVKNAPKSKSIPKSDDDQILSDVHLLKLWEFFGDVFSVEFENWWPSFEIPKRQNPVMELKDAIENQSTYTKFHMIRFSKKNGRPPSIHEFVQFRDPEFIYVRISMTDDMNPDDVAKQIVKLRKKQKKQGLTRKESSLKQKRYYSPTGKIHHDDLKNYLAIYDLKKKKQKLSWNEIMEKHPLPHISVKEEHLKRTYQLYHQKAKEIIKNVELGYFPGPYTRE